MTVPVKAYPKPTAQVRPYVDVLGVELALDFILAFGGSEIYLPTEPRGNGMVERVIGREKLMALAATAAALSVRVPLANRWCAECLSVQGLSIAAIARRIRVSHATVSKWVNQFNG